MSTPLKHYDITDKILKAFYAVYKELGRGFLEKVYESAMEIELTELGLSVVRQMPIEVFYRQRPIGHYEADLIVGNAVIVELKAIQALASVHEAQLLNYLKATRFEVGLLLNFGAQPAFKRLAYDNARKGNFSWRPDGAPTPH